MSVPEGPGGAPRVLVAPDAFKGTLSAAQVAAAIAAGLRRAGAQAEECPVADGGEGTIEVLREAISAGVLSPPLSESLTDPLTEPLTES